MVKTLIFGANGQIGAALNRLADGDVVALGRAEADFSRPESLPALVDAIAPDAIINAAAYTAVDKAEEEEELAMRVNAEAPGALARAAARRGVPFVHYSTDYVFDGSGARPWREEDATGPLNAYGRSKLAGEEAVTGEGGRYLIFRASWVYDAHGKNFLNAMLRLGREKETLRVVSDQHGAPSYAPHLAAATLAALRAASAMPSFPAGVYHMRNAGETTWHGFAAAIFAGARARGMELKMRDVIPIATEDYPTPARRPRNSRLDGAKLEETFGLRLPPWEEGLREALEEKL